MCRTLEEAEEAESGDESIIEGEILFCTEEVPGLLSSEECLMLFHRMLHARMPYGAHNGDPPEARDFRRDDAAVTHSEDDLPLWMTEEEVLCEEEEGLICRADLALIIDNPKSISIAVERKADVRMFMEHCTLEILQCLMFAWIGRVVWEASIRFGVEFRNGASDSTEDAGIERASYSISRVDDDVEIFAYVGE